eukprot:334165-Amphidinium_carterae.1
MSTSHRGRAIKALLHTLGSRVLAVAPYWKAARHQTKRSCRALSVPMVTSGRSEDREEKTAYQYR